MNKEAGQVCFQSIDREAPYRIRKPMGERRVKVQPSPANAEEQGIVKGEGCFCKTEQEEFGM